MNGQTTGVEIMDDEYQEIVEPYEYGGKQLKTTVRFFPNRSIATVTKTTDEDGNELIEPEVLWEGMTLEEIEKYFPPRKAHAKQGFTFNLALLIRSIMYEAHVKQGTEIESGNVRRFWYTHLKNVITRKLILQENESLLSSLNKAWDRMINSGLVTYEGLNIIGGKESTRHSVVKDSPFSNIIIAVEKADYYEIFKWLPMLFNCTLVTASGQPSRAVARGFIKQLRDLQTDLNQTFTMCVASDLDPAGYYIQEAFRKQFESAIRFYGGNGKVEIRRLFVKKEQVSERLLLAEAIPCRDETKTEKTRKAEDTKWRFFCEQTDGGIYIPKPPRWDGRSEIIDGQEMIRALLEMSAFSNRVIENAMIKELLKIIEDTSDESKIMIPELMRIFEIMREEAIDEVYDYWHDKLIKPLIDMFLKDTSRWESTIMSIYFREKRQAEQIRDNELENIDEEYDELVAEQEKEAEDREPELYQEKWDLNAQIIALIEKRDKVKAEIEEKCSDIFQTIEQLEKERESEKEPINQEFENKLELMKARREYREDKLEQFKDEASKVFNPMEKLLMIDINKSLSQKEIEYYFKQLELMPRFQKHIIKLLVEPTLLSEEGTTCFEHPVPTFKEQELLQKASSRHDENIENVRHGFSDAFTTEMKNFIVEHSEGKIYELRAEVEKVDLTDQINRAMEETEKEIEEGKWKASDDEGDS